MQLIAGRTAQECNHRTSLQGALWKDGYRASAVEADEHLCTQRGREFKPFKSFTILRI
jgi:hypothetical protein